MRKNLWIAMACAAALTGANLYAAKAAPASARPGSHPVKVAQAPPSSVAPATAHRAVLDRYCVTCHNERLQIADLALDATDIEQVGEDAAIWEKVALKLRTRTMPPSPRPRPDEAAYDGFASWLESELDRAATASPDPGRPPALHRLNRTEYANAVRDLLALEFDAGALLPADDASYGFDNIGDILRVSPTLLEGYLEAARVISEQAVGDPTIAVNVFTHRVASDLTQDSRLEGLPFGTRGGTRIERYFPVDGEYLIQVRLRRGFTDSRILGLTTEPQELEITVDGERVELFTVRREPRAPRDADEDDGDGDARRRRLAERVPADAGLQVRVPIKAGTRAIGVDVPRATGGRRAKSRGPGLFAVSRSSATWRRRGCRTSTGSPSPGRTRRTSATRRAARASSCVGRRARPTNRPAPVRSSRRSRAAPIAVR